MPQRTPSRERFLVSAVDDVAEELLRNESTPARVRGRRLSVSSGLSSQLTPEAGVGVGVGEAAFRGKHGKYLKLHFPVSASDSRAWGFAVHFSPKRDAARRRLAHDARVAHRERKRMEEEERGQRRLELGREACARAHDRILFTELVTRYGPLAGELYCVSSRPGDVYHKLVRDAASRIRAWWTRYYPDRMTRSAESAMLLQKLYRGHSGRGQGLARRRKEEMARKMCRRLLLRDVAAGFDGWSAFAVKSARVKALFLRAVAPLKMEALHAWREAVRKQRRERQDRLDRAGKRMVHRRLVGPFATWCVLVTRNVGTRRLLQRHWGSVTQRVVARWSKWAGQRVAARREIETTGSLRDRASRELRMRAAKFIQAVYGRYVVCILVGPRKQPLSFRGSSSLTPTVRFRHAASPPCLQVFGPSGRAAYYGCRAATGPVLDRPT